MANPLRFPNCFNYYYMVSNQFSFFQPHGAIMSVFSLAIPTLLNFLVLKYQNLEKSPFETHPKTIFFAISTLLLYCLSHDYQKQLQGSPSHASSVVHHCTVFLGHMAVACLASLLFPDSVSPVLYAVYTAISVADLLWLLYQRMKKRLGFRDNHINLLPL